MLQKWFITVVTLKKEGFEELGKGKKRYPFQMTAQ